MNNQCDTSKYVNCPRCNSHVYEKNLNRHMGSMRCKRACQALNNSDSDIHSFKGTCLSTTTSIKDNGQITQTIIEPPPVNNKSLLNKLLEDQKKTKKENEMLIHELQCLEKMYLKLICAIENQTYKQHAPLLNSLKKDQTTQTSTTYHQIYFN